MTEDTARKVVKEEDRPLTVKNVLEEHKHIVIFTVLLILSRLVYDRDPPWFIIIPALYTGLRGVIELAVSRFSVLKFIGCAILIWVGVQWVLGSGLEMSPVNRW